MKTAVIPCVCCDHKPDVGDSIYYGMPQLRITSDMEEYEIFCPVCGRGGAFQYGSAYQAVKHWNGIQRRARLLKEEWLDSEVDK